jgi:hypothetical protein
MVNKRKEINKFIEKYGCGLKVDLRNKDIYIPSGGLWWIEPNLKKRYKTKVKFNQKEGEFFGMKITNKWWLPKKVDAEPEVMIWFNELDETINYLKKLKNLLNKLGYRTGFSRLK